MEKRFKLLATLTREIFFHSKRNSIICSCHHVISSMYTERFRNIYIGKGMHYVYDTVFTLNNLSCTTRPLIKIVELPAKSVVSKNENLTSTSAFMINCSLVKYFFLSKINSICLCHCVISSIYESSNNCLNHNFIL